jgi:hypothetical protein
MTRSVCLALLTLKLLGQTVPFDFFSRAPYDPAIPRPEAVLGYALGERHTFHHQMELYLHRLQAAAPRRVKIESYGASYEGRKTWLVFLSSEENLARLNEIRAALGRLKDPRSLAEPEAQRLAAATPALVWLNCANDGNESAAFEAALQMAYELAASNHPDVERIRRNVVAILNPAHNPESHDRFVTWFSAVIHGKNGNPDRAAAEHTGDWLMDSNDNHYHFDLNRDALALTQKESRELAAAFHRWNPQVFIDFHGNPPVFFFPPVALPMNLNFPESTARWEQAYGKAIAAEFGRYGWSFMNREIFDLFYPGYWDSYPTLNGATGMTFETDGGGSQGLQLERADKTLSTLRGGIAKHFTGGLAVLKATAENKDQRLVDFYLFRKTAIEEGEKGPARQYILLPGKRPDQARALVSLLAAHQVEVYRDSAGRYVIPLAQPQKRLLDAILEPEAKLNEAFLAEEKAKYDRNQKLGRRAAKERYGFYDITAWSLPVSFGVEMETSAERPDTRRMQRVGGPEPLSGGVDGGRAAYAYVIPYSNASLPVITALLRDDYKLLVARAEFRIDSETFPAGTFVARVERNPASLHDRIAQLAPQHGVRVRAVGSPGTDAGITLGSPRVVDLKKPRVAAAIYEPTSGRSYGGLWFLFEQILDYPLTPIRTSQFRNADLSKYEVVIFVDGSDAGYQEALGTAGVSRLRAWIEAGGVFIGLKGGAVFATRRGVEWTTSKLVGRREEPPAGQQPPSPPPKDQPEEKEVDRTPGAMVRAEFNTAHFLTLSYEPAQVVLHNSDYIFTPSKEGTQVVTYAKEKLRLSGFVWPETEKRLAGTPYLIAEKLGRGHVILFADDPNFRMLWPRLTRLFMNAVLLAPSLP